ncbi:MAG: tetratricopeptide repeat protein, partial [Acidobacteriota bacterium]
MSKLRIVLTATLIAMISVSPLSASWDEGVAAFRAKKYQEAAEAFQSYVSRSPKQPQGHYMLGMSLLQQKRYREALNPLLEAHQLGPGDTNSGLALAQTQVKLGQGNAALETLATVADVPEKQRKNHHKLLALAVDLSDSGRAAQARRLIEQALAVDRSSKALWVALAEVADRTNRTDEKFSALAKAFELDP